MEKSTIIAFPIYIGTITGVSYLRIGVRKIWVTHVSGGTIGVSRNKFPSELPNGNELAFLAAQIVYGV